MTRSLRHAPWLVTVLIVGLMAVGSVYAALPQTVNPAAPADTDPVSQGASQIRTLKQGIVDIFGVPSNSAVSGAALSIATDGTVNSDRLGNATTMVKFTGLLYSSSGAVTAVGNGNANQVMRVPSGGGAPVFGTVNLASTNAVTGTLGTTLGGTGADMSATGGTSYLVKQASAGAALTAGLLSLAELSNATTYKLLQISRDMTAASGAVTTAHGISGTPKLAIIFAALETTSYGRRLSYGVSNGTLNYTHRSDDTNVNLKTANCVWITNAADADNQKATATFDGTNLTLTWTKTGSPTGSAELIVILFF